MPNRLKKTLPRDPTGVYPMPPDPIPKDVQDLLDYMDDASAYAGRGQGAGAPAYDHGVRIFQQLNAHYQAVIGRELGGAHQALKSATNALKVATWWLAGVTVALGVLEVWKLVGHG